MKQLTILLCLLLVSCTQIEELPEKQEIVERQEVQQEAVTVKSSAEMGDIIIAALPISRTKDNVRVRMKITDIRLQHANGLLPVASGSFSLPHGGESEPAFLLETSVPIGKYEGIIFSLDEPVLEAGGTASEAVVSGTKIVAPIQIPVHEKGKTLVVLRIDADASVFTTVQNEKVLLPVFWLRSSDSAATADGKIMSEHVIEERRYGLDLEGRTQSGAPVGKSTMLDIVDGKIVKAALPQQEQKPLVKKLKNIQIIGREFEPAELVLEAGSTVSWYNTGAADHTILFEDGQESQKIKPGAIYSKTFKTQGTYKYTCGIHPNMKGKIIVI